jgi:hypothetical protein
VLCNLYSSFAKMATAAEHSQLTVPLEACLCAYVRVRVRGGEGGRERGREDYVECYHDVLLHVSKARMVTANLVACVTGEREREIILQRKMLLV